MTYKLDITLIKVKIDHSHVIPGNKVWFNFNCDGCTQSATTPCVPMQSEANFGTPCQFIVNTADIMGSYFYLTLCYYSQSNEMIPLAKARCRLGKLPLEANKQGSFEIPLMSSGNRQQTKQIATALFCGTLSRISQTPYGQMNYQTQPQVPMPSYQYPSAGGVIPTQQGSYGGMPQNFQPQGSMPGYQQPGMMAPTPYSGAVPFGAHGSQGMQQQQPYNVPIPGQQQQFQYNNQQPSANNYQQPGINPMMQPGNMYQQNPGNNRINPQQPGSGGQQNVSNQQSGQQQNQIANATIGDNQYYF